MLVLDTAAVLYWFFPISHANFRLDGVVFITWKRAWSESQRSLDTCFYMYWSFRNLNGFGIS